MPQSAKKSKAQLVYLLSDVNIAQATDSNAVRTFESVANSGKPFDYYGQRTIVDLTNIKSNAKTPALVNHDRDQVAGFGACMTSSNQLLMKGTLLNTGSGKYVADLADNQFEWQMSAHINAGGVDELAPNKTTVVNGQTITGPILILRDCRVVEVSFTPTGVDFETSAVVLSATGSATTDNPITPNKDNAMTLEEALAEIETLKAKDAEKDQKIADLTAENDKLKASETKAQVDAQLSQAGFARSDDGKWQGVSDTTYQVLLSQTADNTKAMIGDLKLSQSNQPATPAKPNLPNVLLGEQYPNGQQNQGQGVKLSDNPLIANAQARANQAKTYI